MLVCIYEKQQDLPALGNLPVSSRIQKSQREGHHNICDNKSTKYFENNYQKYQTSFNR